MKQSPGLSALDATPLVAILRGIEPHEAVDFGRALVDEGFHCLEIPLNSPSPFDSIALLCRALAGRAIVGAGTVLSVAEVHAVADAGGRLVVSPNCDPAVIRAAKERQLLSLPGFCTPSEAFQALEAGASGLKLFPAEMVGMAGLKAMRAVLPKDLRIYAVGGVTLDNMSDWKGAGASGFGIGSSLYIPGQTVEITQMKAARFVQTSHASG